MPTAGWTSFLYQAAGILLGQAVAWTVMFRLLHLPASSAAGWLAFMALSVIGQCVGAFTCERRHLLR